MGDQMRQWLARLPEQRLAAALQARLAGVKAGLANGRRAQDRRRVAELLIERDRVCALLKTPARIHLTEVWDFLAPPERKRLVAYAARTITLTGPGRATVEWHAEPEPAWAMVVQALVSQTPPISLCDPPS